MIDSLYLSAAELVDLTGARQKSAQIEWLRAKRWRFEVSREGFPRVARAYWRRRMVDDQVEAASPSRVRPNFAVIAGSKA